MSPHRLIENSKLFCQIVSVVAEVYYTKDAFVYDTILVNWYNAYPFVSPNKLETYSN